MRFHPTEEQLAIQDALRGTLAQAMPPARLRALMDEPSPLDRASWDALMALGLGGLALPEEFGGSGLGLIDLAMAVEVLGEGAAVGPFVQHVLAGIAVRLSPDEGVRAAFLPRLASGQAVATLAIPETWLPDAWDLVFADGAVTGRVRFVPGAAAADLFVAGLAGGGLALVENGPGVAVEAVESADRSRILGAVTLTGAPAVMLLAPGSAEAARFFDAALVLAAADALGGAQHCTDVSVAYAKAREQFGQPIARFQALKHQLASMALEVEPSRALVWYAAHAWDVGLDDAPRLAALAKAHLADRFVSVTRAAVAAHGGIGYTWEYGLNTWFRRAVFDRAYLGSPSVHRARAAALAGWGT